MKLQEEYLSSLILIWSSDHSTFTFEIGMYAVIFINNKSRSIKKTESSWTSEVREWKRWNFLAAVAYSQWNWKTARGSFYFPPWIFAIIVDIVHQLKRSSRVLRDRRWFSAIYFEMDEFILMINDQHGRLFFIIRIILFFFFNYVIITTHTNKILLNYSINAV